jgi:hypothetical protein
LLDNYQPAQKKWRPLGGESDLDVDRHELERVSPLGTQLIPAHDKPPDTVQDGCRRPTELMVEAHTTAGNPGTMTHRAGRSNNTPDRPEWNDNDLDS